jgi:hypothetical protein
MPTGVHQVEPEKASFCCFFDQPSVFAHCCPPYPHLHGAKTEHEMEMQAHHWPVHPSHPSSAPERADFPLQCVLQCVGKPSETLVFLVPFQQSQHLQVRRGKSTSVSSAPFKHPQASSH